MSNYTESTNDLFESMGVVNGENSPSNITVAQNFIDDITAPPTAGTAATPALTLAVDAAIADAEVGGNFSEGGMVNPPITGQAAGTSGYTIGYEQLDFANNTTGRPENVLSSALDASGNEALAFQSATIGNDLESNLPLPSGITIRQINVALATPASQETIEQDSVSNAAMLITNVTNVVNSLTNATNKEALTPGSSTFDPVAFLYLTDYANHFSGFDQGGPLWTILNSPSSILTSPVTFGSGAKTGATVTTATGSLAGIIQAAEAATFYADPNGAENTVALGALQTRFQHVVSVGTTFAEDNNLAVDSVSGTITTQNGQTITATDGGHTAVSSSSVNLEAATDSAEAATVLQSVPNGQNLPSSYELQTILWNEQVSTASEVSYSSGSGGSFSFTIDNSGDPIITLGPAAIAEITGIGVGVDTSTNDTIMLQSNSSCTVDCPFSDAQILGDNSTISDDDDGGSGGDITVDGNADTVASSNDAIELSGVSSGDQSFTLNGGSDVLTEASNEIVSLNGSGDTINGQSGDQLDVFSSGSDTLTGSGQSIDLDDTDIDLTTSNNTVYDFETSETINGNSNAVGLDGGSDEALTVTGSGDAVNAFGTGDTIDGSGASIFFIGTGSGAQVLTLVGDSDTVGGTTDASVNVTGTGDTVNGQAGDTVNLAADSNAVVNGDSETVNLGFGDNISSLGVTGSDDQVNVVGSGDSIIAAAGTTFSFADNAFYDSVATTDGTLTLGSDVGLSISGSTNIISGAGDDTISVGGSSSASIIGSNDTIVSVNDDTTGVDGVNDVITASDGVVDVDDSSSASIVGSNDTIYSADNDTTGVEGTNDVVGASNGVVNVDDNSSATVIGSNDEIYGADNDTTGIQGTNDVVNAANGVINIDANSNVSVVGSNDTIQSADNDTIGVQGTSDLIDASDGTVNLDAGASATISGNEDSIASVNGDTTGISGTDDTLYASDGAVNLDGAGSASLNGSADTVNLDPDATFNLESGTQDTINGNGGSAISIGGDSSDAINGDNDTITLADGANGSSLDFSGGGNQIQVDGSDDQIDLESGSANDTLGVDGSGNTLTLNASNTSVLAQGGNSFDLGDNISGDVLGSNDNTVNFGSGDGVLIGGTGNTVNTGSDDNLSISTQSNDVFDGGSGDDFSAASSDVISEYDGSSDVFSLSTNDTLTISGATAVVNSDQFSGVSGDRITYDDTTTNVSQIDEVDPNSSTSLEYSDYSGLNGQGSLQDTTTDDTNGTSDTTFYDLGSSIRQETEDFSGLDDSGNLTTSNTDFTDGQAYYDSYVYNGTTLQDYYQTVDSSNGTEVSEEEFNAQNQDIDNIYGSGGYGGYEPPSGGGGYYGGGYDAIAAPSSRTDVSAIGSGSTRAGSTHLTGRFHVTSHDPIAASKAGASAATASNSPQTASGGNDVTAATSTPASMDQMIQAMASFSPTSATQQSPTPANTNSSDASLASAMTQHMH